jgi:RNA polymerase sigma-B factor
MVTTQPFATERDATAHRRERDRLVQMHLGLANSLARRFVGRGEELDDLRQVALLALVQTADRFDPARGFAFSTFATPTLTGALKRHLRDHAWSVRPPRRLQERYLEVAGVIEHLTGELKRVPTTTEIAVHGEWSEGEVIEARAQQGSRYCDHLDATEDGDEGAYGQLSGIDVNYERIESREQIDGLLTALAERERTIVELRFFGELDQADIGRRVGLSQMHVSRLIKSSIRAVRPADVGRRGAVSPVMGAD